MAKIISVRRGRGLVRALDAGRNKGSEVKKMTDTQALLKSVKDLIAIVASADMPPVEQTKIMETAIELVERIETNQSKG